MDSILSQYSSAELARWAIYFIALMAVVAIAVIADKVWRDD